jgi:HEAT repeat protein
MTDSDPEAIKQILVELRDFNKDKRRTAVMKLGMLGGDEAITTLILLVQNTHEDLIARGRAALMLGKLGDPRAVSALIQALDAPGYQTPLYAAQALGKLGDARAVGPLLDVLSYAPNDNLREAVLEALRRLGHDPDLREAEAEGESFQGEPEHCDS